MSMHLSKKNLRAIDTAEVIKPDAAIFDLPERILQFGTGVLLRGLPDYFVDKANRQGLFNGRIVVIKSTDSGDANAFDRQDGLYTLCIRGIAEGKKKEENIICSAISRVMSAKDQWRDILALAHSPEMQIIVSNTTEVGIQLVDDNIHANPPSSFPGKLLAFLYERYRAFQGSAGSGMVIVPTELIVDNGKKLAAIVWQQAMKAGLSTEFIAWVENHCHFCNSLVDRIVPGKPEATALQQLEHDLGYKDDLLAISEVYRLWAIEGNEKVRSMLSFADADAGVVIRPDIEMFRELKLRLLNGTHTLSCGLAFLAGFQTVKAAMEDAAFSTFVTDLMFKEIAPSIPYEISMQEAGKFGNAVLDRFRNPYIEHQWINITMQYSSKMRMRDVPVLLNHYALGLQLSAPPGRFALGFAAYLLFMRAVKKEQEVYYGEFDGKPYPIKDDKAGYYFKLWQEQGPAGVVETCLQDKTLWGSDLSQLPGFEAAVKEQLEILMGQGAVSAIARSANTKNAV